MSSSNSNCEISCQLIASLHKCIEFGDQESVEDILKPFTVDEKIAILTKPSNFFAYNSFHLCCKTGNIGLLEHLLDVECLKLKKKVLMDTTVKDGDSCLLLACSKRNNDLAAYLIFNGADVNIVTNFGRNALHICALTDNVDIFMLLVKYGANLNIVDALKCTPLLSAAYHGNASIVDCIAQSGLCSRDDIIIAYEALGCSLVQLLKHGDAIRYWKKALNERSNEPEIEKLINQKPNASYLFELEFRNDEELNVLIGNPRKLILQSIIIMERICGPYHLTTLKYLSERLVRLSPYNSSDTYSTAFSAFYFERNEDYDLSILLVMNKIKNQNQSDFIGFLQTYDAFHNLLVLLIKRRQRKIDDSYSTVLCAAFELYATQLKLNIEFLNAKSYSCEKHLKEFDETLVLLGCYIIFFASLIESGEINNETTHKIKSIIYSLIKLNFKCFITGYTILHLALSTNLESVSDENTSYNVVKLLLECGASAMEVDSCHNTALHIIMAMPDRSHSERIKTIKLLIDAGAHLDAKNKSEQYPTDFLNEKKFSKSVLYSSINPLNHLSLKCFAAQAVQKYKIDVKGKIPTQLEKFVSFH